MHQGLPLYQLALLILIPPASMTPGSSLTTTLKTAPSPMPTVTSSPVQVNHADYYSTSENLPSSHYPPLPSPSPLVVFIYCYLFPYYNSSAFLLTSPHN